MGIDPGFRRVAVNDCFEPESSHRSSHRSRLNIAMLRFQDNPPVLSPADAFTGAQSNPWVAAYCRPRQEKALAWDLKAKTIPYFLPMVSRVTSSGGKRRRNLYPLFPSYLFLCGGEESQLAALRTGRVVQIIRPQPNESDQLQQELHALHLAIEQFPDALQVQKQFVCGSPVRIKSGPMAGIEGVITKSGSKSTLYIGVSCLGVGATVAIHPDLVEPC